VKRIATLWIIFAVLLLGATASHAADPYPTKPLRLILPFPPSGGTDTLGRGIAQTLSSQIGHPVIADNRPGAGGTLGLEIAAEAPPDGYTMVLSSPLIAIGPVLFAKLNFDAQKELAPVTMLGLARKVIVVHPAVPAKTLKELVALARKQPGKLNFGSGGIGTSNHLTAELLKSVAGIDIVHVPYKGTVGALSALVSGDVDMVLGSMAPFIPLIRAGRVRALAVLSETRTTVLPELPTAAEAGFPGVTDDTWYGMFVPAATPRAIVDRLNQELHKALATLELVQRLETAGIETRTSTPEELGRLVKSETARFGKVIRRAGIKPL
jgi:tripartite-type tricarboxylate transporter receptor subunit TctC